MTETAVVHTNLSDSAEAGRSIARQIADRLGNAPDAVILFASTRHDFAPLLRNLSAGCEPKVLIGGTSAGEFTREVNDEGLCCAVAIRSSELRFGAGIGHGLRANRTDAAKALVADFQGLRTNDYAHRSAIVLTDATAGNADEMVAQLTILTAGQYQLCGGGVGGDANFGRTQVFFGAEAFSDAAVALEILSNKPIGIGAAHGWEPASAPMRVTEADGMRLISLNAMPAAGAYQEYAEMTGQRFDRNDPLPFFLHNLLGIKSGDEYKLRVPLSVNGDGSIVCATEIPAGATVKFMTSSVRSAADAAARSAEEALRRLNGNQPAVALFFDCVGTRLRLGREFGFELDNVIARIETAKFAGCNTIGQIVRADGQFSGFHNCTAVVCAIPQ